MSDTADDIRLAVNGPVATLVLRRIARRNALDGGFASAIAEALRQAEHQGARLLVLRSEIPVFSAGVDLHTPIRLDPASPELIVADALLGTRLFVVSVIEGPALAGALMLAALTPLAVASEEATFWLPERRLGLYPGRVLAYLEEILPPRQAHWLALTEERITARRAQQLGLVSTVLATEELAQGLDALLGDLLESDPTFLVAARETWLSRYRSEAFLRRVAEYDALLAENLSGRSG